MKKPNFIIWILENLLPPDLHHLIGDLEEEFIYSKQRDGITRARIVFWWQLIRSLPWFIVQSLIWNTEMLLNYLKITWRNFKKYTSFSVINIIGLSASMSVCLLILLFLIDQKSSDYFHQDHDRIVRVISDFKSQSNFESDLYATSPYTLPDILKSQFPEIEQAVKVRGNFSGEFNKNSITIPLEGISADEHFLDVFDFELAEGNPKTALTSPGSVILSRQSAQTLFGDEEPLGKSITALGDREYTVTGIIDEEYNTHFRFQVIASLSTLLANPETEEMLNTWNSSIFDSYTYLLLKEGTDFDEFEEAIQPVIKTNFVDPEERSALKRLLVQPLTSINLGRELANEVGIVVPGIIAWFLSGFAIIIVVIAIFNYVSLTIARALNRGKEVGVRKVLGANRGGIIKQFLFESVLIATISMLFGIVILRWLVPEFNSLFFISFTENQVNPYLLLNPITILSFLAFAFLTGILAGIYPSLYLSKFSPARILKGTFNVGSKSGQLLKKMITVGQFTFSIVFIITSMILIKQFEFMTTTEYGFEKENIVHIEQQDISYNQIREVLNQSTKVSVASVTSTIPALGSINTVHLSKDQLDFISTAHSFYVDENYIAAMGLELVAGRNFNADMTTDSSQAIIISVDAVHELELSTPIESIGKTIEVNEEEFVVIGVINGFITSDPMNKGNPIALFLQPQYSRYSLVKVLPGQTVSFINEMEEQWAELGSLHSFKYQIFDDQLKESPILIIFIDFIKILGLLGVFSIFISCLGLLGMAMYSAENRVKEIGIRKVLGATVNSIVFLLSKEYLILIIISIVIALPASFLINNLWMESISNKVALEPSIFILGAFGAIILALLTIGTQALKAARGNSIDNLRSD
ncbi:MAG: ABC transporter permease [Balneolaceae bacterium]